jgi:glutaryl-CoA dehydrogenase
LPVAKFLNDLDGKIRLHVAYDTFSRRIYAVQGVDFYRMDDLLSDEDILVRDTVRRFVDEQIVPIIDKHFEDASFPRS